jgi:hypothetical protein
MCHFGFYYISGHNCFIMGFKGGVFACFPFFFREEDAGAAAAAAAAGAAGAAAPTGISGPPSANGLANTIGLKFFSSVYYFSQKPAASPNCSSQKLMEPCRPPSITHLSRVIGRFQSIIKYMQIADPRIHPWNSQTILLDSQGNHR